ncbi:methyltransferase domain-containing protein, partial [Candidatus Margulisiibacteriota bacterium]
MLDSAKELKRKNLSFQLMDINLFRIERKFDLIFSNATLHWVKDHNQLLMNCKKHLNENGRICFNFAGDGNCGNFFRVVKDVMAEEEFKPFFTDFKWPWFMPSAKEYSSLLSSVDIGFTDIDVREENRDRYFAAKDEMIAWIDQPSIVPFLTHLEKNAPKQSIPSLQKLFRDLVVSKMIELCQQTDGRCFETFRRINVFARKN